MYASAVDLNASQVLDKRSILSGNNQLKEPAHVYLPAVYCGALRESLYSWGAPQCLPSWKTFQEHVAHTWALCTWATLRLMLHAACPIQAGRKCGKVGCRVLHVDVMLAQSCGEIRVGFMKSTIKHDMQETEYFARELFERQLVTGYCGVI